MSHDGTKDGALAIHQHSDADLAQMVRQGDMEAYASLFERYRSLARGIAARELDNPVEAEDLASEAFLLVLRMLSQGRGPALSFRSYLVSVVLNLARDTNRRSQRALSIDDKNTFVEQPDGRDAVLEMFEAQDVARAFAKLPENYRDVLWATYVDQLRPRHLAAQFKIKPNAVSALRLRALERLRSEYMAQHLKEPTEPDCREHFNRLADYSRNKLRPVVRSLVQLHLEDCSTCVLKVETLALLTSLTTSSAEPK